MNSSREPGRWVGFTTPTTPRQLANTTTRSFELHSGFKNLGELCLQLRPDVLRHLDDLGELALELAVIRHAGIDQDSVVKIAGKKHRVASRRPGFLDDVDVGDRIEARAHRPQDLI